MFEAALHARHHQARRTEHCLAARAEYARQCMSTRVCSYCLVSACAQAVDHIHRVCDHVRGLRGAFAQLRRRMQKFAGLHLSVIHQVQCWAQAGVRL